ncbi:MAG: prevent-host-death protein [Acidimicrobiales bacterium]
MAAGEQVRFESYSQARAHLKALLDAAAEGRSALIRRATTTAAVVDASRLRAALAAVAPRAEVVAEAGGWSVFVPGVPVAADGPTFDEAVDEMIDALRDYAEDWESRLRSAPNHQQNWPLVQLIALSDDHGLRTWLVGEG